MLRNYASLPAEPTVVMLRKCKSHIQCEECGVITALLQRIYQRKLLSYTPVGGCRVPGKDQSDQQEPTLLYRKDVLTR